MFQPPKPAAGRAFGAVHNDPLQTRGQLQLRRARRGDDPRPVSHRDQRLSALRVPAARRNPHVGESQEDHSPEGIRPRAAKHPQRSGGPQRRQNPYQLRLGKAPRTTLAVPPEQQRKAQAETSAEAVHLMRKRPAPAQQVPGQGRNLPQVPKERPLQRVMPRKREEHIR